MSINLPNQITLGRLALSIVFFALLSQSDATVLRGPSALLQAAFWVFIAAAISDILDGMIARMTQQITVFGRIVDPVVDKVIVCGGFVFLASSAFEIDGKSQSYVQPWMVIVVLVRELLVSAIRSYAESGGRDFSAIPIGKVKMFVQCATIGVILGQLGFGLTNLAWLKPIFVWATVIVTAASALAYIARARRLLSAANIGETRPDQARTTHVEPPNARSAPVPAVPSAAADSGIGRSQ